MEKYRIFLFKNKVRYKFLKSYKLYENAVKYFENEIKKNDDVIFETKTVNGKGVKYEIAILELSSEKKSPIYIIDEFGRNIPILSNDPNYNIIKINEYKMAEEIFHVDKMKKISMENLLSLFFKDNSMKMISKLNNKIVIQNDDSYNLFSLKSENDAERFLESLENYMRNNDKKNYLFVKDVNGPQKKYLYNLLTQKGYNKKMLYRKTTTHPKDK